MPDLLQRGSPPSPGVGLPPSPGRTPWGGGDNSNPNWQTWGSGAGNTSASWQNFNAPQNPGGSMPMPDSGGGSSGAPMSAFDDGGDVSDSGGGNSSAPSLDDALSTVKTTLAYGRAQNGIGQGAQGGGGQGGDQSQQGVIPSPQKANDPTDPHDETYQENINDQSPGGKFTDPALSMYGLSGAAQGMSNARKIAGFADGGDMGDPSAGGAPPQPQTNQPVPQPGGMQPQQGQQPPSKLVGYAMGAQAVPPDMARALESKVDPQGTMDPTTRKMLAIASAPDQKTQWGMLQNYRQQFNAHASFARAAATGSQTKPADMAAAAKAATDAFSNVPDGTQTTFQPTQGGVVARIKHLVGGKTQAHAGGGPVRAEDHADERQRNEDATATGVNTAGLARGGVVGGYDDGGDVNPMGDMGGTGGADDTQNMGVPKQGSDATGEAKQTDVGPDQGPQQDTTVVLPGNALSQMLAKLPFDYTMDHGIENTLKQYAATNEAAPGSPTQQPQTGPWNANDQVKGNEVPPQTETSAADLNDPTSPADVSVLPQHATPDQIRAFNKSNGGVNRQGPSSQTDEDGNSNVRVVTGGRLVPQGTQEGRTQKNAIALEQEKRKTQEAIWGIRAPSAERVAQTRADASKQNNVRTVSGRLQAAIVAATGRALSEGGNQLVKRADAMTAAGVTDPKQLAQGLAPFAQQANMDYGQLQLVIRQALQGQSQQAPQETGGASQQTLSTQDQAALAWAKANSSDPRAAQIKQRLGM
jgi:hypothetical protein